MFPGRWQACLRDPASYFESRFVLALRVNGQLEGEGWIGPGAVPVPFREIEQYVTVFDSKLKTRGKWFFEEDVRTLTLETTAEGYETQGRYSARVPLVAREDGTLVGEDLTDSRWVFRRMDVQWVANHAKDAEGPQSAEEFRRQLHAYLDKLRADGAQERIIQKIGLYGKFALYIQEVLEKGTAFHSHKFDADTLEVRLWPYAAFHDHKGGFPLRSLRQSRFEKGRHTGDEVVTYRRAERGLWQQVQATVASG